MLGPMNVSATTLPPGQTAADTIVVGVFEGEDVAHDTPGKALQSLLDSGETKRGYRKLGLTHAGGKRWILAGLGQRDEFVPERARVVAALATQQAAGLSARVLCWEVPHDVDEAVVGALVEGTGLAAFRFEKYRSEPESEEDRPPPPLAELIVSAHDDVSEPVARAATIAEAVNAARVLQNTPGNEMTPTHLAARAADLAAELDGLTVEVEGRLQIQARGMGAFSAVAQGSEQEPALITLRYDGPAARGPVLGFVGKAVTFDSGGISLKPGAGMSEMKFDMSGGAAVLEAVGAIARLGLPIRVVAVIGATENLPSGRSVKPGDIVRAMNGTTIEVNNTDAEGRLVLSDCLAHAIDLGAERVIDLATLTGAIIVSLGFDARRAGEQRRRLGGRGGGGRDGDRRDRLAPPAPRGVRRADQGQVRRHRQRSGGPQGRVDHGGRVSQALRRRDAVGPPRHRRDGLGPGTALRREGGLGLRRAAAGRARPVAGGVGLRGDAPPPQSRSG